MYHSGVDDRLANIFSLLPVNNSPERTGLYPKLSAEGVISAERSFSFLCDESEEEKMRLLENSTSQYRQSIPHIKMKEEEAARNRRFYKACTKRQK